MGISAERAALTAGLPVRARIIDVNGVATYVAEGGAGPPLVLLHGGIESAGAYWGPVVAHLARSHRLIIPDAPGLGESAPVDRLDAEAFEAWFSALLRGTDKPIVLAHSLFGTLAARFAARNGGTLSRLILWGTPGVGDYRLPPGLFLAAARFGMRPSRRNLDRLARWPFIDLDECGHRYPGWFDAFLGYTARCGRIPHIKRTMRYLIRTCTTRVPAAELASITVPTSLLWGTGDRMVPVRIGRQASAAHGWPLDIVAGGGHVIHLERPDAFLEVLRQAGEAAQRR